MQTLIEEYKQVGHVPFKDKDQIFREYHDTLDYLYKKLNKTRASKRLNAFKEGLKEVAKRGERSGDRASEDAAQIQRHEAGA